MRRTASAASGDPILGFPQDESFGLLNQGSLETSNVEIVTEMTEQRYAAADQQRYPGNNQFIDQAFRQ